MAWVKILNEVPGEQANSEWQLCFHECRYHYDDGSTEDGYRFIWRRPDGSLQAARGQARIPSAGALFDLLRQAEAAGWFDPKEE